MTLIYEPKNSIKDAYNFQCQGFHKLSYGKQTNALETIYHAAKQMVNWAV